MLCSLLSISTVCSSYVKFFLDYMYTSHTGMMCTSAYEAIISAAKIVYCKIFPDVRYEVCGLLQTQS